MRHVQHSLMITAILGVTSVVVGGDDKPASDGDDHHYLHKKEKPHAAGWGYDGRIGPAHWGDLSPDYALAKSGRQQSPIDISQAIGRGLPDIRFQYRPSRIRIVYNGHTVEDVQDEKSAVFVDNHEFHLKQFHFHSPSEHTVKGRHFPMEMHLVHATDSGRIAVVAVLISEGKDENVAYRSVWNHLPTRQNRLREYPDLVETARLLPRKHSYYRYDGSFTTPPCTERVTWLVMTETVTLSGRQIADFRRIINGNNRPVQPLNDRVVFRQKQ